MAPKNFSEFLAIITKKCKLFFIYLFLLKKKEIKMK